MTVAVRIPTNPEADELDRLQSSCDLCCAIPAAVELDGDRLCQSCADKWVRGEQSGDDLLPLDHPVMREALADWNRLYAGRRAFRREQQP